MSDEITFLDYSAPSPVVLGLLTVKLVNLHGSYSIEEISKLSLSTNVRGHIQIFPGDAQRAHKGDITDIGGSGKQ
jgi:hypothetical protein